MKALRLAKVGLLYLFDTHIKYLMKTLQSQLIENYLHCLLSIFLLFWKQVWRRLNWSSQI